MAQRYAGRYSRKKDKRIRTGRYIRTKRTNRLGEREGEKIRRRKEKSNGERILLARKRVGERQTPFSRAESIRWSHQGKRRILE